MKETKTQGKEIELRSEEAQDVLGKAPSWIIQRGISLLGVMLLILFAGSWFFKYPQIIKATLTLTSSTPPAYIVARASGKITELKVQDLQKVESGDCLAVIENPASYNDILALECGLKGLMQAVETEKIYQFKPKQYQLGGIQSAFSSFVSNFENYNKFLELNYYPRKIASVKRLIEANAKRLEGMRMQMETVARQHELEKKAYIRSSYLKKQSLISEEEMERAQGQLLQSNMSVQSMNASLENQAIQIAQTKESLIDLEQQFQEKKNQIFLGLRSSYNQLQNEIRNWKMTYLLCSPISGKVSFTNVWACNQNVSGGEVVFTVVPTSQSEIIGKAQLPIDRSGKVKVGQKVNVHFNNFPDNEFGIVKGVVGRISLVPTDKGTYIVEVKFPNGLKTSYGKQLPLTPEMTAGIDIITDDLRLIEQLYQPIKTVLKNNR